MSGREIIYELDEKNRIHRIQGPWDQFLNQNPPLIGQCDHVLRDRVLGQRLEPFILDDNTRMFFTTVFQSVRQTLRERRIEYRCDSPDEKRFMCVIIEPIGRGKLRLIHQCLKTEPMAPPVVITPALEEEQAETVRCSICNRIEFQGIWMEPDIVSERENRTRFMVSYTVCPLCQNQLGE